MRKYKVRWGITLLWYATSKRGFVIENKMKYAVGMFHIAGCMVPDRMIWNVTKTTDKKK